MSPADGIARELAVENERIIKTSRNLLHDVEVEGGRALTIRGPYGQGKTFTLHSWPSWPWDRGFLVSRPRSMTLRIRLTRPDRIVHQLLSTLRFPDTTDKGYRTLAGRAVEYIRNNGRGSSSRTPQAIANRRWLLKELDCEPLSWLLSDPDLMKKNFLIELFGCEPGLNAAKARTQHVIPVETRIWPAFNASTQGDFASYLLSGIGRLSRLLGFKGFIIILDEMEKWQDLNWAEQSRAGNLLGGLIWGSSAAVGARGKEEEPLLLRHSGRCGGYPFTTEKKCHLGLAIAMTPRGETGPKLGWSDYGVLEVVDLPTLSEAGLVQYCRKLARPYGEAYGLAPPAGDQLDAIANRAAISWLRGGDLQPVWAFNQ